MSVWDRYCALEIEIGGKVCKLKREGLSWVSHEGLDPQLAEAMGNRWLCGTGFKQNIVFCRL